MASAAPASAATDATLDRELPDDLIRLVLPALGDGEAVAAVRAVVRWKSLNKAHRRACSSAGNAVWAELSTRIFPGAAILFTRSPSYSRIMPGDERPNFLAQCRHLWKYRAEEIILCTPSRHDGYVKAYVLAAMKGSRQPLDLSYGDQFRYVSKPLRADREVVLAAMSGWGGRLEKVDAPFRADREVVRAAISQDGRALIYASRELQEDPELQAVAALHVPPSSRPFPQPSFPEDNLVDLQSELAKIDQALDGSAF